MSHAHFEGTPAERSGARRGVFGSGLAKGLAVTLRTMTRRSVTEHYPDAQPELPPRRPGGHRPVRGELHRLHAVRP